MTGNPDRPSFLEHFTAPFVDRVVEKGFLGKRFFRFWPYLNLGLYLYESGVVLGLARRDRLETLAKLFSKPGDEKELCAWMRDAASKRLQEYDGEPETFGDFFLTTELPRLGLTPPTELARRAREKIQLTPVAQARLMHHMPEGVGFGAVYPELAQKMWGQGYETPDQDWWAEARQHGLDIPEEPEIIPLEQRQQDVLLWVAAWVHDYHPELIEPLGLTEQLEGLRKDIERQ
jgi:hypothetical protein